MTENKKYILVCNVGSSSIKTELLLVDGLLTRTDVAVTVKAVGQASPVMTVIDHGAVVKTTDLQSVDFAETLRSALSELQTRRPHGQLLAVGHRIVHGGDNTSARILNDDVVAELEDLSILDPDHMPAILDAVQILRDELPEVPHVACFDTVFFKDLPEVSRVLPLPQEFRSLGLRRYGFHGLSYAYLLQQLRMSSGDEVAHGRVLMAHLGSGASMTVLMEGVPIDTTMSFTPASGLVMSSRSGNLDPGIGIFLERQAGVSSQDYARIVNQDAGLRAISGYSADMKTLLHDAPTNHGAALAVSIFCREVQRAIGGFAAIMGGVDTIVFSGGVGEESAPIREYVCKPLDFLGVRLDDDRNQHNAGVISSSDSRVAVHVIKTDEAQTIAQEVLDLIKNT